MPHEKDDSNPSLTEPSDSDHPTVGKKQKSPPSETDTATKSGKSNRSKASALKKYSYTDDEKQALRKKHYEVLHEIQDFLRTNIYPKSVKGATDRSNF